MSKPKHEDADNRQLATYVPARLMAAIEAKAQEEKTTKRAVVVAALSAHLGGDEDAATTDD